MTFFFFFFVVRSLTISKETCIKFISSIRRTIITTIDCTKFYQSIRILVEYLPSAFFSFFFFFFFLNLIYSLSHLSLCSYSPSQNTLVSNFARVPSLLSLEVHSCTKLFLLVNFSSCVSIFCFVLFHLHLEQVI